ncbi:MAG: hypothetical protein Q9163_001269 [Psora crenata]
MRIAAFLIATFFCLLPCSVCVSFGPLTLSVPPNVPALPSSTTAILVTNGTTIKAPVTRRNTFVFHDVLSQLPNPSAASTKIQCFLEIACRDYDFASYGLDVFESGEMELYRVARGGIEIGERVKVGASPVELKVLRVRDYYEVRAGFSPMSLLKNPMVLIGVVGLAFVMGMPYLMENMDPEMRKEFEEQQKNSILSRGAANPNPLQNFDMAAWMAGKSTAITSQDQTNDDGGGGGPRARRKG